MYISDHTEAFLTQLNVSLSESQRRLLQQYAELVINWNTKINLVRYRSMDELWERHILESLILLGEIRERRVVDVGAGAGFLSIPLAICHKTTQVVCLEYKQKRAVFLSKVIRDLQLPTTLIRDRLERWLPEEDLTDTLLTARALPKWQDVLPPLLQKSSPGARIALFVGKEGVEGAGRFLPFWELKKVLPIPAREFSKVILLENVSRET